MWSLLKQRAGSNELLRLLPSQAPKVCALKPEKGSKQEAALGMKVSNGSFGLRLPPLVRAKTRAWLLSASGTAPAAPLGTKPSTSD